MVEMMGIRFLAPAIRPFRAMFLTMFLALVAALAPVSAGESLWSLQSRTQGTVDFKPGNDYFTGPEIGYSNYALAGHSLQLRAAWLTTRMEQVFRPNILKYDLFQFSPTWHFRRNALFDPTFQADAGYIRYDIENEKIFHVLKNTAWLLSVQPGLNLNLGKGRYGLHYQVGYNLFTPAMQLRVPGRFRLRPVGDAMTVRMLRLIPAALALLASACMITPVECDSECEESWLDGDINDSSFDGSDSYHYYRVSKRPDSLPQTFKDTVPVLIAVHGFSASTYEWLELRRYVDDVKPYAQRIAEEETPRALVSLVLLGGHGRTSGIFRTPPGSPGEHPSSPSTTAW